MDLLWTVSKILIVIFAATSIGYNLYANREEMDFVWSIWKRFRIIMFIEVLGVICLTITALILMMEYIPFLKWGWWALFSNSSIGGNIFIAPIYEGFQSSNALLQTLAFLFFAALLIVLPFSAKWEEEAFRKNHVAWNDIAIQSTKFGFVHLLFGVPLAAGFALTGVGFYYAFRYRRALVKLNVQLMQENGTTKITVPSEINDEAILVATTYHTLNNSILVAFLLAITVTQL